MAYDLPAGLSGNRPTHRKDGEGNISNRNVCSFIKATALQFLQIAFSQRPPGHMHYAGDTEETEIKIVDQYAFQTNAADVTPAIIGVRGPLNYTNPGMNRGMLNMNIRSGEVQKTALIGGSIGLACLSSEGLEAEELASDVFNLFHTFEDVLKTAGFFSIKSMTLGTEQMVSAAGEPKLFMVNVALQCQMQNRWVLHPKAVAELRNIIIEGLAKVT